MTPDPTKISAQPPPENPAASGNAAATAAKASKGERMFDWLAYGGFAGVATFILSMPMGYWARYSSGGKQSIKWAASKLKPFGFSEHVAEDVVMNTALMQGGNVMLLGVKGMENHKEHLVNKFNQHLGDEADYFSMEGQAKQSWGSLITSRLLLAWTPVFLSLRGAGMLFGKDGFNAFEEKFSKHLICDPVGKPTHINGRETKLYKLGRIAAIDLFATTAAATLLYIGSRFFAKQDREKEIARATPASIQAAAGDEMAGHAQTIVLKPDMTRQESCARCKYIKSRLSYVEMVSAGGSEASQSMQLQS